MVESGESKMIGAAVKRREDPRLVTGEGKYTDDVPLRGMTYMAVLRSPHARARIRNVDTSKAEEHPEILTVLAGEELKRRCRQPLPLIGAQPHMNARTRWPMATDAVRYVGEPVAAIVATSRAAARDALELIEVDYEPLPTVADPEKAVQGDSPLVHDDLDTNLCVDTFQEFGDPDAAFRDAAGVVSLRLEEPRIVVNPMEPRAVVASYERASNSMTLWDTTQHPHTEGSAVAEIIGFPENKIRVIAIDVGGGFGCKHFTYSEPVIAALLSWQLSRPVKWVEDRQEHFIATSHGRGEVQYAEAAYDNNGILTALRIRFLTDMGAFCHGSSHLTMSMMTPSAAPGVYTVKNLTLANRGVYTNKIPVGPYRGYGRHCGAYVGERMMDLIATELGLDPAEVRKRNFISKDAFPYKTPTNLEYDSGDYEAALDKALNIAGYDELRAEQRRLREQGILMGIGIGTTVETSGFGPSRPDYASTLPGYESATIRIDPSGRVTVLTGSSPHGQGLETTLAQVAADELGVPFDDIEVLHGDTALTPRGAGTGASRSIVVGGTAVIVASDRVKEKASQVAAAMLQTDPEHVLLEGGRFFAEDIPDRHVTWAEVGKEAYQARHMPMDMERGLEATAYWQPLAYTYPFSANIAVVIVDRDTGEVKITKYVSVDDCGVVVNPMVVEGQVHGGLAQGIGAALLEGAIWDENGQLLTGSFMDYAMPFADEFPSFILDQTVTPTPHNPMGAKGGGEMGTIPATCAVVNAVVDALSHLGLSHIDIPVKAEKVWRLLKEKGIAQ